MSENRCHSNTFQSASHSKLSNLESNHGSLYGNNDNVGTIDKDFKDSKAKVSL